MPQCDTHTAGSATGSTESRRLPAALLLLIIILLVPFVLFGALKLGQRALEADHYAFVRAARLGMTQMEFEGQFGRPFQSLGPDQQRELGGLLGPDEALHTEVYYHTYRVIAGQRPMRFARVCVWHTGIARGEFVFFDEQGQAICILSGSS